MKDLYTQNFTSPVYKSTPTITPSATNKKTTANVNNDFTSVRSPGVPSS
jgi:hypothetical protein